MIVKNKDISFSKDIRQIAGDRQEQDVAFFLRRTYKDNPKVFVFNDLRFEHNDEVVQIDHLILYPYGFVLIESKSITGEVKVNQNQEWSRSYNKQWSGMPSPIKQVEEQQKLLRKLLSENRNKMLRSMLFGKLQSGFAGFCWDQICAISSNAIIERDNMPKKVSKKLIKSEFVTDTLNKLMNIHSNIITSTLKFDTRVTFTSEEMDKITDFLMQQHKPSRVDHPQQTQQESSTFEPIKATSIESTEQSIASIVIQSTSKLGCKKCNNTEELQGASGKFGYYVKCPVCKTNTSMKKNCPSCNTKNTKVKKRNNHYYLSCQDCGTHLEIFTQGNE